VTASNFVGSASGLTNIPGANVIGTVANATYAVSAGSANTANLANLANIANLANLANIANSANIANIANIANYANAANISNLASYVTQPVQSNITAVGTLNGLSVSGNANVSYALNSDTVHTANLQVTTSANFTGNIRALSNVNLETSPNINLGPLANIHIEGGTNGYVLSTDGAGNLSWSAAGGGSGGTPGGANTQVQFNNNGAFGGSPNFTYDVANNELQVSGHLSANTIQIGSGSYHFGTSEVYFASTASSAPDQVLYSIPVAGVAGVEFHIIATDHLGQARASYKITSVVYGTEIQFTEYAGLYINGGIGSTSIDYYPGDSIIPPSLRLSVTPQTSNQVTYKMLITVFSG
jgi:hypothetical protein